MHELSVCQQLLQQVARLAADHDAQHVDLIHLRIGPLSGVEPQLLERAFPIASAGTVAHAARLIVEPVMVRVRCLECGEDGDALPSRLLCPHCGAWHTRLISGDELLLVSVELARSGAPDPMEETRRV